ncbi:hypothetical protein [Penaeicola halotolerans]|uniref:hypothetical protein n=1 Tax=Penaeicola halotolerans TaxID=2793196 RepID=UPI001CF8AD58|nr:hypothetical protein [Penaeicola halotolerans]
MIICKPKANVIFLLTFLAILFSIGVMWLLRHFYTVQTWPIYVYIGLATLLTLAAVFVLIKLMSNIRFLTLGKGKISIRVPLKGVKRQFPITDIAAWKEEIIKANSKEFKHLTVQLPGPILYNMSNHESTNYEQAVSYLRDKVAKKQVKS